ncbi:MAG: putative metal-dependent hydrolase [Vicinamibacterales bacterium]|nr:putative metal-dependent hydrolase [Vicinamibacterales bacterium]
MSTLSQLQYPIGRPTLEATLSDARRRELIDQIAAAPGAMAAAVAGLSEAELDTPYRPGGWTVRQLVHHVADSHINAYIRCKFALTEKRPTIMPYDQDAWASLTDARTLPPAASLALLAALHERWVTMWRALGGAEFARELHHPENGPMTLDAVLGMYAWHGRHHVAQLTGWREREGV